MEKISNFRGVFRDDLPARAVYSEAAGIGQIIPRAVAVPADAGDVVALVQWAALNRIPLIPRGSGSSMAGGAIGDGVIVDLSRLRELDEPDRERKTIKCGPGVLRAEVDAAARSAGLTFPVDPSSGAFCTVGGMASTNAAGARTMRYGATREWVESLDCVFADGTRALITRGMSLDDVAAGRALRPVMPSLARAQAAATHSGVRKESSGYGIGPFVESHDLVDLLVGSEGTLALIVGLELRLMPLPAGRASVLGAFASLDEAVEATAGARELEASACELLDKTFLDVARSGGVTVPVPESTDAVLLTEFETTDADDAPALANRLAQMFWSSGAIHVEVALDAATEDAMWTLRHAASPVLSRLDPALKSMQFIEDGCVPPARLGEYVRGVRAALARQGIRGVIFGHAGDAHVHVNPLIDVRLPDWRVRAEQLLAEVTGLVATLGGTLSGEHGDGRLRTPLYPAVWSDSAIESFTAIKRALDPEGVLNPGVKVAADGARAIDRVKYDPALPPLPTAARASLASIERDRSYARSRLELLAETESP